VTGFGSTSMVFLLEVSASRVSAVVSTSDSDVRLCRSRAWVRFSNVSG